jgi:hypothetical protein
MTPENAEIIALQALVHILDDYTTQKLFLDRTGLDETTLRTRVKDRDHLVGILDYMLTDESLLTTFCNKCKVSPENAVKAWKTLSKPILDL